MLRALGCLIDCTFDPMSCDCHKWSKVCVQPHVHGDGDFPNWHLQNRLVIEQQRKLNYQTAISAFKQFSCSSQTSIIHSHNVERWGMSESQRSSFSMRKICHSWGFSTTLRDWPIISHNPDISILRLIWSSVMIHSIIASMKASGEYSWAQSDEPLVSLHDCWPCLCWCWITRDRTTAAVISISS